jgi:3-deoxy-D-manno-octulosonic-acid transferase
MIASLYRAFTSLVGLLAYPYGRWQASAGSELWRGRLGLIEKGGPGDVWLHASSVGEVRVMANLVGYLLDKRPQIRIHVTTMTAAGQSTARAIFGGQVRCSFFPLDSPAIVRRTLDAIAPRLIVIAETEIWPNLVAEAARRKIPLIMVNGRMSGKALRRYMQFRKSFAAVLETYDRLFLKTDTDARRYTSLGLASDIWEVAGDMKFDAPLPDRSPERVRTWREKIGAGEDDFVMVAGSTREGEEEALLEMYKSVTAGHPNFRMIIAPRHVERATAIMALCERSRVESAILGSGDARVTVVNRVGLLNDLYVAADLAFVGGTLVDIGGHNLLEPVWAGTPVLFGPSLYNVEEAARYIVRNNYGAMLANRGELAPTAQKFLDGGLRFAEKNEADLGSSATAIAGAYILEKLSNA